MSSLRSLRLFVIKSGEPLHCVFFTIRLALWAQTCYIILHSMVRHFVYHSKMEIAMLNDIITPVTKIQALKTRDDAVWRDFVAIYHEPLLEYATNKARAFNLPCADAEDCVQHVYDKLAQGNLVYKDNVRFRSILMSSVKNALCDCYRKRQTLTSHAKTIAEHDASIHSSNCATMQEESDEQLLALRIRENAAQLVLSQVSPRNAEIFQRCVVDQERHAQVAQSLGLTTNHVDKILFDIKAKAKKVLAQIANHYTLSAQAND